MTNRKDDGLDELAKGLMQFFREKNLRIYVTSLAVPEPERDFEGEKLAAVELAKSIRNIAGMVLTEEKSNIKFDGFRKGAH